ncbi:phytanoyl-CoA dioxygenase family protein [Undibacterium sp. TJN19]|uniref:phytanoyl-CoA dioxygenase family protein n=1 Tax=Undibacterium sp. TJN19 TaxID=3413055 RepID=UPI003BF28D53
MPYSLSTDLSHDTNDMGQLGVPHLKAYWLRMMAIRNGEIHGNNTEYHTDRLMLHSLGLGLEQTIQFLLVHAPDFVQFEQWVVATAGHPSAESIARLHALINKTQASPATMALHAQIASMPDVLSQDDLQHWEQFGYVILSEAVSKQDSAAAAQVVWNAVGAQPDDVDSWYHDSHSNIMVQLFQAPAFEKNRRALRIHKAYAQLWGTVDLWASVDRCGFNVPERDAYRFQGPDLHWDMSLQQPVPFATQGILYLTDTPPEQGALTLVPGFHHQLSTWLNGLADDEDPRKQDLHALGSMPIGGKAGDLIIWHQALPHGSRPNRGRQPRLVQYINMFPAKLEIQENWL